MGVLGEAKMRFYSL